MSQTDPRPEAVATGDRRDEVHFEADASQGVKAAFLQRPDTPPGPDMHSARTDDGLASETGQPVEDLRVPPDTPSVWDARPPEST